MFESSYDFLAPNQIAFGWGRRSELASLMGDLGQRVFVVSGSRTLEASGLISEILDSLSGSGRTCEHVATISHEPEVSDVDELVRRLANFNPGPTDCLMAIGGGSAIDLAKAASAMVTNRESATVRDYLEGVGAGLTIKNPPIPLVAIPTTAGTGTEATKNAVISCYDPQFKKSLRSNQMIPNLVVVDPELTIALPSTTTAFTGMDAITQLIESYVSCRAKPIPQALCLEGLSRAIPAILHAVENGTDLAHPATRPARTAMSHAALLSGMALANSGLGMAHGVAAALGVHAKIPHGQACAIMLPVSIETNIQLGAYRGYGVIGKELIATINRQRHCVLDDDRLQDFAHSLDADDCESRAESTAQLVRYLGHRIDIPTSLSSCGVHQNQVDAIANSSRGNSMSGNPVEIDDAQLKAIIGRLI